MSHLTPLNFGSRIVILSPLACIDANLLASISYNSISFQLPYWSSVKKIFNPGISMTIWCQLTGDFFDHWVSVNRRLRLFSFDLGFCVFTR